MSRILDLSPGPTHQISFLEVRRGREEDHLLLLASTDTRTVLCDTGTKTFREISGRKAQGRHPNSRRTTRQSFGAGFLLPNSAKMVNCDGSSDNINSSKGNSDQIHSTNRDQINSTNCGQICDGLRVGVGGSDHEAYDGINYGIGSINIEIGSIGGSRNGVGGHVYAARPGCRLQRAELSGEALETMEFKEALRDMPPARLVWWSLWAP